MSASRVYKSFLNARVNVLFYFAGISIAFYSRKVFLDIMGPEFLGLLGVLGNIMNYLNLAELGVGSAMAIHLYKPIQDNNKEAITKMLSLFRYLYFRIGLLIAVLSVIVSYSFPILFKDIGFAYGLIYFAFFTFLFSSLLGYFINFRLILLRADQKEFKVTKYIESIRILTTVFQIILLNQTRDLYLFLSINILMAVVNSYAINKVLDREYGWLETSYSRGREVKNEFKDVFQSVRRIFFHKTKDFLVYHSDQIFIYAFESLKMITYYGNYLLVADRTSQLFALTFNSFIPSVGNMVAEGDRGKIIKVFWELMVIRYLTAGLLVFCVFHLITPFIELWLGGQYVLADQILVLVVINLYLVQTRNVVDMFINAYGLYADVWAAISEVVLTVAAITFAGYFYGLEGVLIGKIIGHLIMVAIWKPYYLFSYGFRISVFVYWSGMLRCSLGFLMSLLLVGIYVKPLFSHYVSDLHFFNWIIYSTILTSSFAVVYILLLIVMVKGSRDLVSRISSSMNPS